MLKEKIFDILGENSGGIYSVGGKGKDYFLENFDSKTYRKKFSKEIIIKEEDGLKTELARMLLLEENLIQLTYNVNKETKELNVFGYLLDKDGKITSERKDIITASFEKKSRAGYQDIRTSRDGSKLLVCNSTYFKKGSDFYQIDLTLYSSDLEPIIKTTTQVPVGEKTDISVSNFYVGNDGGFFMALTEQDLEKGVYVTKKFDIYSYQPYNGFQEEKIEIDLQDKMATSIALTSDRDGNLIGAGFYGEKYNAGIFKGVGLAGSYFIKIDPRENKILNSTMQEFSSDFTARVLKEKKADKGKLIPNYFTPLEIIGKGDGGAVMISEYQQVVFNSESRVTTYVHGPLAIVDIMPDGNINWVKPISKNQLYHEKQLALGGFFGGISISFAYTLSFIESQTVYHSALFGVRGDKLIVMYNDNPDNQEIEHFRDTKKLVGYLKSVPVVVEIDRDGKMKKSLLEGGKSEVVFRPGVSIQVKQGETIIYGTRRKEEKVGRLTY
ncbi:MAG: hypothetical protein KDD99_19555 [Bacteroidetes bacterium]|nr:hypothetical protein [Bacteroidota bacterium]